MLFSGSINEHVFHYFGCHQSARQRTKWPARFAGDDGIDADVGPWRHPFTAIAVCGKQAWPNLPLANTPFAM
jgi:hypothetical protein